jgi:hypothetical protein
MADFIDMLPTREATLDLPPEALGALLMEFFYSLDSHQRKSVMRVAYIVGYHMVPEGPRSPDCQGFQVEIPAMGPLSGTLGA